mgnify:CR=1 FL=1
MLRNFDLWSESDRTVGASEVGRFSGSLVLVLDGIGRDFGWTLWSDSMLPKTITVIFRARPKRKKNQNPRTSLSRVTMCMPVSKCNCVYCTTKHVLCDDRGEPFKEVRISFPTAVRLRFADGLAVVAVMQDVDGPVRMGDGTLYPSLESATVAAYNMQKRQRPVHVNLPATLLWTINLHGVSVAYGKLDILNKAAFTGMRHPTVFTSSCIEALPINRIAESGLFTGSLERLLKLAYRPSFIVPVAAVENRKRKQITPHARGSRGGGRLVTSMAWRSKTTKRSRSSRPRPSTFGSLRQMHGRLSFLRSFA